MHNRFLFQNGFVCLILLGALAGCHLRESQKPSQDSAFAATASATGPIEARFKENPSPQRAYRVTLDVADAPGPFAVIEGFAQFTAPNCTYVINKAAGAIARPEKRIPVAYTKINERTYVGTVHIDAMLDEDYFGKGVCRWELVDCN